MKPDATPQLSPVLFIPHGAGPLPLLGDQGHQELIDFLRKLAPSLGKPTAIVVISAHWEAAQATITSAKHPALLYDYYGFPDAAYHIDYPAPGAPALAQKIAGLLQTNGLPAALDGQRGFDHGLFVPLKILFPEADVPCVQLSLVHSLDPNTHIQIGKALSGLRKENILILGSGFSFHNLKAFFAQTSDADAAMNAAFDQWLIDTCTDPALSAQQREALLTNWHHAPFADYCHPRPEHLLPLHVCAGLSASAAKLVFNGKVAGKLASAFLW